MANTAAYNGFQQYSGNGSAPTYEQVAVKIVYNASAIFYGDPVELLVRDDLTATEVESLLREPGVRYVREDVIGEPGPVS